MSLKDAFTNKHSTSSSAKDSMFSKDRMFSKESMFKNPSPRPNSASNGSFSDKAEDSESVK